MLKGKTALVTGSTQGLGLATVERLASYGCNIMMNGLGNAETIEANRRRIARRMACACCITARTCRSRPRSRRSSRRRMAPSAASTSWSTMPSSVTSRRSRTSSRRTGTARSRSISPRRSTPRGWFCPGCATRLRPHRQHRLDLRPARRGQPRRLRDDQDGADRLYPRGGAGDRCAEHYLQRDLPRLLADARIEQRLADFMAKESCRARKR